jgi:hypothetical protein
MLLPVPPEMLSAATRMANDTRRAVNKLYAEELERTRREFFAPPKGPALCWDVRRGWEAIR